MKPKTKSLAEDRKWKRLVADIKKANQDPEFRKAVDRFIKIASNHE